MSSSNRKVKSVIKSKGGFSVLEPSRGWGMDTTDMVIFTDPNSSLDIAPWS